MTIPGSLPSTVSPTSDSPTSNTLVIYSWLLEEGAAACHHHSSSGGGDTCLQKKEAGGPKPYTILIKALVPVPRRHRSISPDPLVYISHMRLNLSHYRNI